MRNLKDAIAAATALLEVNPDKTLTVSRSLLKTLTAHAAKTQVADRSKHYAKLKADAQQDEIRRLESKVRLLQEKLNGGGRK